MSRALATVEEALAALRAGEPVLVLDDAGRENEGDVIIAGEALTTEWMAWTVRHTSGYICTPMPGSWADRLDLPPMVGRNEDSLRTAYTITCDAATGVTTGISAADRAHTVRTLADATAGPGDLIRPGHIIPLRAVDGGVLQRTGHTEAAVDLCRLAGLAPVAAIGELVHDDGSMMRTPAVLELGEKWGFPVLTIADLVDWRERYDRVRLVAETTMPTAHGTFTLQGYLDQVSGAEHLALLSPLGTQDVDGGAPTVRIHSECLTGDALGSRRCDCGPQLQQAMAEIAARGGAVVYLRGHEGRGVGLLAKLQAYRLQDEGFDTIDAQGELGLPVDDREYGAGAAILHRLGLTRVTLLTNNPLKVGSLDRFGIHVETVRPLHSPVTPANLAYLRTKRDRLGHTLPAETDIPHHEMEN